MMNPDTFDQPHPEDWVLVPPWKGYALFGTGQYVLNHTPGPADPELGAEIVVTLATDKDRAGGRKIGESRDTDPDAPPIQPRDMVIRMGFLCPEAIDALEDQLIMLRRENFPETKPLAQRAVEAESGRHGSNVQDLTASARLSQLEALLEKAREALLRVDSMDWSADSRNGRALLAELDAALGKEKQ